MSRSHEPYDVLVAGGGAAGVLAALHLLRQPGAPLRVALVERGTPGEGIAYGTDRPEHVLNVIAKRMSAFDDVPDDLVRFLAAGDADAADKLGQRFVARRDYARYLATRLDEAVRAMPAALTHVRGDVVDLVRGGASYVATLADGTLLQARAVVLALGNTLRKLPVDTGALAPGVAIEAWDAAAIAAIRRDADVCIVGSGLTMVDVLATLDAIGHAGRVHVLSRHGHLPLPHAAHGSQSGDARDLAGLSLTRLVRLVRDEARRRMAAGEPWQWTMDRLRPHVQALWRTLDAADQRRFLRHVVRQWDIHRHRIAPASAAIVDAARASGRLAVHAGRLTAIDPRDGGADLRYRPRGRSDEQVLHVDHVVNAMGLEVAAQRIDKPLVRALLAHGLATPGPLGLGVATDASGALRDRDGHADASLLAIGSLRIGELWESLAIPELRTQAADVARPVRALLGGMPTPAA